MYVCMFVCVYMDVCKREREKVKERENDGMCVKLSKSLYLTEWISDRMSVRVMHVRTVSTHVHTQ